MLSDADGLRVEGSEVVYAPFGEIRIGEQSELTDFGFTGQRLDESTGGLMYYGARYYLPELRRFISADTIVPGAGNPQHLNRYSYVLNSPLVFTDPTGHTEDSGWFDGSENHPGRPWWENCGSSGDSSGGGGGGGNNPADAVEAATDEDGDGGGGGNGENGDREGSPIRRGVASDILDATVVISWHGESHGEPTSTRSLGTLVIINGSVYIITHGHGLIGVDFTEEEAMGTQDRITISGANGQFTLTGNSALEVLGGDNHGTVVARFPSRVAVSAVGTPVELGAPENASLGTSVAYAALADTSACPNPHDCVHVEYGTILTAAWSESGVPGIIYSDPTNSIIPGSSGGGVYVRDAGGGWALIANNWLRRPIGQKQAAFGALIQ